MWSQSIDILNPYEATVESVTQEMKDNQIK